MNSGGNKRKKKRSNWLSALVRTYGPFRDETHAYHVLRRYARPAANGYRMVATSKDWGVYLHRAVMAVKVGRPLRPEEQVHHRDRNRANNHPDNLQLCASSQDHDEAHGGGFGVHRRGNGHWVYSSGPDANRYVARVVVERALGRKLRRYELVAHLNGDLSDNRIANLQVMSPGEINRQIVWARRRENARKKEKISGRGGSSKACVARRRSAPQHAGAKPAGRRNH